MKLRLRIISLDKLTIDRRLDCDGDLTRAIVHE